jgi:DNA-directed RNA polymerase specialized sigma24 family protein
VLPGEQSDVHDRLLNWGTWCQGGGAGARGRAASAEGRYDSRAGNVYVDGRGVEQLTRGLDAETLNSALLTLPVQHRTALQLRYFKKLPDRLICRMLDLRWESYSRFMGDARLLLHAALQKQKTPVKLLPHN